MSCFCTLPPFSADYAGAGAVFFDLIGTMIINGADGCLCNYSGYDEPRYFKKKSVILGSGLREIRLIYGDEDFLLKMIPSIESLSNSNYLLLLSSPATAVIGTDHEAIAQLLDKELDFPVIAIETTGMETYEIGASKALMKVAQRFIPDGEFITEQKTANVIGAVPMDYWGYKQVEHIYTAIENSGYSIKSCFGIDGDLEKIKMAPSAEINIVVSVCGLEVAEYMKEVYGIPYFTGVPVGKGMSQDWISYLKGNTLNFQKRPLNENILIIGQQIWANCYREAIEAEFDNPSVTVVSFFRMDKRFSREGDVFIKDEDHFIQFINSKIFDTIIGDSMFCQLLPENIRFVEVPHSAVSSRYAWFKEIDYVGENALNIFYN